MAQCRVGDTVYVRDYGAVYKERVIKETRYPYEPKRTEISIGRVRKDLFFYLNQIGSLSKRYKKVSSNEGKINAMYISGNVSVAGITEKENGVREFSGAVDAPYITLAGVSITEKEGEIFINGKRVLLEEEADEAKS